MVERAKLLPQVSASRARIYKRRSDRGKTAAISRFILVARSVRRYTEYGAPTVGIRWGLIRYNTGLNNSCTAR